MNPLSPTQQEQQRRGPIARALHLLALCGFAVAQPLFEVLKEGPSFFAVRGSQALDLWILTVGLTLVPAALLFTTEFAAGLVSRTLQRALHLLWVALLVGVTLAPVFERALEPVGLGAAGAALIVGCLGAFVYNRSVVSRSFLDMLSPAPVLFAALFIANGSIVKLALPAASVPSRLRDVDAGASLVYVIFDELPLTSLLSPEGKIERNLFPNFARLADTSTWFRNATASDAKTRSVVPAMLTGQMPVRSGRLPIETDYPDNIFTLLGGSYRARIHEPLTRLCPRELVHGGESGPGLERRLRALADDLAVIYGHVILPRVLSSRLPDVSGGWGDFMELGEVYIPMLSATDEPVEKESKAPSKRRGSAAQEARSNSVREFVAGIDTSTEPTFYFLHVLLPHGPWRYLPSGTRYRANRRPLGNVGGVWGDSERVTDLSFQRHLLQVGYVDRLLGEILDRLQEQGVFDDSVVVITADHGASFRPSTSARKVLTEETLRDVMHVPLFVKLVGQSEGRVSDRNVQSMDILPTIADALAIEVPWDMDGTSALDPSLPEPAEKTISSGTEPPLIMAAAAYPGTFSTVQRKTRLFGADPDWDAVYALGPAREWIGTQVAQHDRLADAKGVTFIEDADWFEAVGSPPGSAPCYVTGHIQSTDAQLLDSELLLAVNGVLSAQLTLHLRGPRRVKFAAVVPDSAFKPGPNSVDVFALQGEGKLTLIPRLTLR